MTQAYPLCRCGNRRPAQLREPSMTRQAPSFLAQVTATNINTNLVRKSPRTARDRTNVVTPDFGRINSARSPRIARIAQLAWVVYGLGSENQNVPGYIVLQDPRGGPVNGA